jgi:malate dehydrogenase (oxaloacetate-decarboxylating)(NADP+)
MSRLKGPNYRGRGAVLVMPARHTANLLSKLLQQLGGGTVIGPLLLGLDKLAQITDLGANVSDIVNLAALTAHDAIV